jgi:hypothetical protein
LASLRHRIWYIFAAALKKRLLLFYFPFLLFLFCDSSNIRSGSVGTGLIVVGWWAKVKRKKRREWRRRRRLKRKLSNSLSDCSIFSMFLLVEIRSMSCYCKIDYKYLVQRPSLGYLIVAMVSKSG